MMFLLVGGVMLAGIIAFWPLADVFILSLSLAAVVMPLKRRLCRHMGEGIAALAITAGIVLLVTGILVFTAGVLSQNLDRIGAIAGVIAAGAPSAAMPVDPAAVLDGLKDAAASSLGTAFRQIPALILRLVLFFLALFILVRDGDRIWQAVIPHLPRPVAGAVHRMSGTVMDTLYALYVVHFSTALLTFLLALPFFTLLGYGDVVFLSLVAAVFQLFPLVGDSVLFLIMALYALALGDLRGLLLIAFIGFPVVSAIPDLYYRPLMMGNRTAIHPILMWIGFFGGAAVLGTIGIVIGPVLVALIVAGYPIVMERTGRVAEGEGAD